MKINASAATLAAIVEPMIARITIDIDDAKAKSSELRKLEPGVMTDAAIKKIENGIDRATKIRHGLSTLFRTLKPIGSASVELNDLESAYLGYVEL